MFWLEEGRPRARGSSGIWCGVIQLLVTRVCLRRPTGEKNEHTVSVSECWHTRASITVRAVASAVIPPRNYTSCRGTSLVTHLLNCVFDALPIQLPILVLSLLPLPELFDLRRGAYRHTG